MLQPDPVMGDTEKSPLLASGHSMTRPTSANHGGIFQRDATRSARDYPRLRETHVDLHRSLSGELVLPLSLSWTDLKVSVTIPGKKRILWGKDSTPPEEKQILKGVNGIARPGTLLAIMGASGSGKSTLLNVLTQRNTRSYHITGEIRVNGLQIGEKVKNISAYVQQDDIFIDTLTVSEQLQFRALLRMDNRLDTSARMARVEEVIHEMGLTGVASSRIGSAGGSNKGLSGGERKRLSFASEALTNPPVFFCDEPTSGLDTFMAQNIVQTLQKMALRGRAILCTIHQPSSQLFVMFNQILLLAEGRTAFMGSPEETMDHFQKLNFPCPHNFNPADHYIMTLAIIPGKEEECRKRCHAICDSFDESPFAERIANQNRVLVEEGLSSRGNTLLEDATREESRYEASWLTQCRYLFWRAWITQFRDVVLFRVRAGQMIVSAVTLGLIYLQLDVDQKGVMDINGAIFIVVINMTFTNLLAVLNSFPIELPIFSREYGTQLYRSDVYFIAKSLSEIPTFTFIGILFVTIAYWMMGLQDSMEAFFIALGVLLLTANISLSLGYLISTVVGSVTTAIGIAPVIMVPLMLFGGFFLNIDNTPVYFIWLEYLSWFKYATEIMMVNQWKDIDHIPCEVDVPFDTSASPLPADGCHFRSGDDVLRYNSFKESRVTVDVIAMVALIIGLRILAYIALFIRARRSKEFSSISAFLPPSLPFHSEKESLKRRSVRPLRKSYTSTFQTFGSERYGQQVSRTADVDETCWEKVKTGGRSVNFNVSDVLVSRDGSHPD